MRLIDEDEVVKFYKNIGKEFPELSVGVHFSINDIINNLNNIDTVKNVHLEGKTAMTNAEWMIKNGMKFLWLSWAHINGRNIVYCGNGKHTKEVYAEKSETPQNLILKWLDMKHKEPIIDDDEKKYLEGVIRPFRESVYYIKKSNSNDMRKEYISIHLLDSDVVCLPWFMAGTMYKDMEIDKEYTLEELGL